MILALTVFGTVLFANLKNTNASVSDETVISASNHVLPLTDEWLKSKDGMWPGMMKGKTYWYKLDKNAKLWWSTDGSKWTEDNKQMWEDKNGKWIKVGNGKLVWSTDMGKTWNEVPEWKWEGSDGKWYEFDKQWTLWVKK